MSTTSPRRRLWIALGVMSIVGGLVAAAVIWNAASQRRTTAIENFARAPVGCDTTLDFIEPGEYLLFVETAGRLDGVRGDCDVEGAYDNDERLVPDIEITLVDPGGDEIDLDGSFGEITYDAAGFRGVALRSVEIEEIDDHVLRAESDTGADGVVVIAVGRDPGEGVAILRTGSIAAALIGLLAGLAFLLTGTRRSAANVPADPWTPAAPNRPGGFVPGGPVPQGPPVFERPSGPPQFGQGSSHGASQPSDGRGEPPPFSWQPPDRQSEPPTQRPSPPLPQAPANPNEREQYSNWAPQPPPPEERSAQQRPPPPPPQ